jgi:ribonuclease PH
MSAGISMYDSFLSCSVGYFYHSSQILLDLNQLEIYGNENTIFLPLVMKGKSEEIIFMELNNRCKLELLEQLLQEVMTGCRMMRQYLENAIKEYMLAQLENQQT